MGTKRKADEEILEILSDGEEEEQAQEDGAEEEEDDGNDSDVQIQESTISVVTLDDDDDDEDGEEPAVVMGPQTKPEPQSATDDSPKSSEGGVAPACPSPPPATAPPAIPSSQNPLLQNKEVSDEVKADAEKPLLSLTFRDAQLFQLFKGSLTEYLKTTFQLKLAGTEVEVLHHTEDCSITIHSKQPLPADIPTVATTPEKPAAESSTAAAEDDGMFVIDSTPAKSAKGGPIIPSYRKAFQRVLDNSPAAGSEDSATKRPRPKQLCWNCDGEHSLRDCKEPRNFAKINKMKQEHMKKMDRYHVDLEQKYGHIVPGRLTPELRDALGLRKHDLPLHVYRMRVFGYPPGWLEEAKITRSGLQLFDSRGAPVQNSDDESDGEVDARTTKYDVRKIVAFPGFNVAPEGHFYDDAKFMGLPQRSEHQSRDAMIRGLECTLVQGYRRKKLRLTEGEQQPEQQSEAANCNETQLEADMDLDDNPDESFTTLDSVGECDSLREKGQANGAREADDDEPEEGEVDDDEDGDAGQVKKAEESSKDGPPKVEKEEEKTVPEEPVNGTDESSSAKDDSLILIEEEVETITLDDSRVSSPSLEDLRRKQLELLQQLGNQSPGLKDRSSTSIADLTQEDSLLEDVLMVERLAAEEEQQKQQQQQPEFLAPAPPLPPPPPTPTSDNPAERPPEPEFLNLDEIKMSKLPYIDDAASTGLKTMSLGTPILTPFTPWNRLPCGDAFSKGVSDVINFENLPNSTGKYERMKSLLSKVRTVIHAHNGEAEEREDGESR